MTTKEASPNMVWEVIRDLNAGNGSNTYYKSKGDREYCLCRGTEFLRDSKGRVRRFSSRDAAEAVARTES